MILEIWQSKDLGRLKGRRGLLDGLCDRIGVSDVGGYRARVHGNPVIVGAAAPAAAVGTAATAAVKPPAATVTTARTTTTATKAATTETTTTTAKATATRTPETGAAGPAVAPGWLGFTGTATYVVGGLAAALGAGAAAALLLRRGYAVVEVHSNVKNSEVYLGSSYVGRAPLRRRLRPGRYEVVVRADGYAEYREVVEVRRGDVVKLMARLEPLIRCEVRGAKLLNDVAHLGGGLGLELVVRNVCKHEAHLLARPKLCSRGHEVVLGVRELGRVMPGGELRCTTHFTVPRWVGAGAYDLALELYARKGGAEVLAGRASAGRVYILEPPESFIQNIVGHYAKVPIVSRRVVMLKQEVVIDDYKLIGFLGEGAFSCAFTAIDPSGGVCVVKLPKEVCMSVVAYGTLPEGTITIPKGFIKEAEVLKRISRLEHPHIVKFYGTLKTVPALVMEYCEGGSLADVLKKQGRLDPQTSLVLAAQIADALVSAYSVGLVAHMDLKPSNILFTRDGLARLTDFNIARVMGTVSRGLTLGGTPGYMAPEQVDTSLGEVSEKSDVFALAIILYEALTGRNPLMELVESLSGYRDYVVRARESIDLSTVDLKPDARKALEKLIRRSLSLKPEERPTMKEFRDTVADVIQIAKL